MAAAPYVFHATAENFTRLVLENSQKGPVLVSYWSPHAGPCLMLKPRLERLAEEFGGRFLLVMLDTDEYGALARTHGGTSIPTVKVFRHGSIVDTLHGAESETQLRRFLHKHVPPAAAMPHAAALARFQAGDLQGAARLAAEAALAHPDNLRVPLDLAKLLILQERYAQAEDLLLALPPEAREQPEVRALTAHAGFLRAAREAPPRPTLEAEIAADPGRLEARYQLAALQVTTDDYAGAMAQLLEIQRRDAGFRQGVARRGLLALFALLGDGDERVRHARTQLGEMPR
jgi:putative thioredoxin